MTRLASMGRLSSRRQQAPAPSYVFPSDRAAAEFLMSKVMAEARQQGIVISDIERRYLLYDEDKDAPDAELDEFGDQPIDDLEERAVTCLKAAYQRDRDVAAEEDKYQAAKLALEPSDIYISYLTERAIPSPKSEWNRTDTVALGIVAAVVLAFGLLAVVIWLLVSKFS